MAPLDGLYTTPEIKAAFIESIKVAEPWLDWYMKAISVVKYSKTIASVATHSKNVLGNLGFAMLNGHIRIDKFTSTVEEMHKKYKSPEHKDIMKRYIEIGLVQSSVGYGEIMDMLKDANWDSDLFIKLSDNRVKKAGKKIVKGLADLYQAEDDFWKIFAFKNESARYEDILIKDMGMSKDEAERYIANIVTNTYPTYFKLPEAVRRLRRFPLLI